MTTKKKNDKRKLGLAVLAGLALTGLVGASAASLGGINNEGLGADADNVASCDSNGVAVGYDTRYGGLNNVAVDKVIISEVHANCATLTYEIQLYNGTTGVIIEKTGTIALTPMLGAPVDLIERNQFEVSLAGDNVDAEAIEGIAITITGNDLEDITVP